mmetsp:Transcript_8900/g.26193  ORF Transcript_8900/g.26193 Transcript_8900/m.26193 type:complete len:246 (-) Transcript_8900:511-1248(-)
MMPSLEPSLRFSKIGIQPSGSLSASSAYPWFCGVMKQRLESRLTTGWFWPRLPKGSLYVVAPAARPSSWLPRQIPKSGLTGSSPDSIAAMASRMWPTVLSAIAGLPGPLDRKRPSWSSSSGSSGVSHGTRVTSQPRWRRERMMLYLIPQSVASTLNLPPLLNTRGSLSDTSATRLRSFGSSNAGSTGSPPRATAGSNSMVARRAPFSRIFLVSSRVSMPYSAGTPCSLSHCESERRDDQCEWWCE